MTAEHVTDDMASIAQCRRGKGRGLKAGTGDIPAGEIQAAEVGRPLGGRLKPCAQVGADVQVQSWGHGTHPHGVTEAEVELSGEARHYDSTSRC